MVHSDQMNRLVSCGLQWELHQKGEFGPMYHLRLYQPQSTRTTFSFCCFTATHQSEQEKMHFSENCHYLFLSIIISPLRIYCGQERFLDRAGWTWKAWDFFFFSTSEGPDAASEKLYLTQWAGKPHENSCLSCCCLETYKIYNSLSWYFLASAAGFRWNHDMESQKAGKKMHQAFYQNSERFGWLSSWRFPLKSNLQGMF